MNLKKPQSSELIPAILLFASIASAQDGEHRVGGFVGQLPLVFETNRGQTARQVKFLSRGSGYTLFLAPTEAVLSLLRKTASHETASTAHRQVDSLRIKLLGAASAPGIIGIDPLPGKSNYFIGGDPKKWHTDVPTFLGVKYEEVYPGIDLVYYGNQGKLEHDFIVRPGANPGVIRLGIRGTTESRIEPNGDLALHTPGGTVVLQRPLAYQEVDSGRRLIPGRYTFRSSNQIGFEIGPFDTNKTLVIDPVLSYSTYLGGTSDDIGNGIAVDSAGYAYVTGSTASVLFPTVSPYQPHIGSVGMDDAFVTKVSGTGNGLVYSTYLGGSGEDFANAIAVDASGNAYVTGQTNSNDFPTTQGALRTTLGSGAVGFVTKLNPQGNALLYSTFLGGTGQSINDSGIAIAVDSAGNAYVTGQTNAADFPTTPGALRTTLAGGSDAFVAKLNPPGSALLYSTFLGGADNESGNGIAVDPSGNAFVAGNTSSVNFPTTAGAFQIQAGGGADAFVTKLNATGSRLLYSTYLGGSTDDMGFAIALDSTGAAYVAGVTSSANFPTKNAFLATLAQSSAADAFVAKFEATGALAYSTFLGGSGANRAFSIAVSSTNNAYVTGRTDSSDFPTERPIQAVATGGPGKAFVAELNAEGNGLIYSTYLGGSGRDRGFAIALDARNNAYVTGWTDSTNFPTTSGAFQGSPQGMRDAIVVKIDDSAPDFSLGVASSRSASVNCGQTARYDMQVLPVNGFTGSVSVNCDLAAQGMGSLQGLTCRTSAGSVNVTSGAAPFSVSVVSTGRSTLPPIAIQPGSSEGESSRPSSPGRGILWAIIIAVSALLLTVTHRKPRLAVAAPVFVVWLLIAGLVGCFPAGHAIPGNYSITVSATSQNVTRSTVLNLAVDCPK